jgi:multiple sugar transport system ATP-binding protein
VLRTERLSDQHLVHVALASSAHELVCSTPAGPVWAAGDAVQLRLLEAFWFDASGQRVRG